jgi:hypothetical protein
MLAQMRFRWVVWGQLLSALSMVACGGSDTASEGTSSADVGSLERGGQRTTAPAFPEVGIIGGASDLGGACFATLIAPQVAITTGGCVDTIDRLTTPARPDPAAPAGSVIAGMSFQLSLFTVPLSDPHLWEHEKRFPFDKWKSIGQLDATISGQSEDLNADVGLVHLSFPVPADVATPVPLAETFQPRGSDYTILGTCSGMSWGCSMDTWFGARPIVDWTDMGAPARWGGTGPLWGVVSHRPSWKGQDKAIFGSIPTLLPLLKAQMAAWDEQTPTCDAETPCDFTWQGLYCRRITDGVTKEPGTYRWMSEDEADLDCNEPAHVCTTVFECGGRWGYCSGVRQWAWAGDACK